MSTWREIKLKDVCEQITVGHVGSMATEYKEQGIPFLRSLNINPFRLSFDNLKFIDANFHEKLKKSALKAGDLVIVRTGYPGTACVIPKSLQVSNCSDLVIVRVGKEINPYFLAAIFNSNFGKDLVLGNLVGAAQQHFNVTAAKEMKLTIPSKAQQDKIAAILSAYDDLIENNKRRIALLENMAEEIYREWFVRFRFPNYKNVEFEKGIPKGWELVTLDKAFKCLGGGTPSKESNAYWKEGDINWYTPSDITGAEGFFLNSSKDKCNEEGLARSSAKMFPAYSIMMTSRATIGAIGINTTPACTNQGFITCIPNKKYPLTYLYYWFKLSKSHFVMLSGGATFPELSKTTFKRIEILTPSHEIIDEFDKIVKPIFEQVEKLLAMNESLKQSKNSLLPRLISGKLTVENLNIQFPPSMEM